MSLKELLAIILNQKTKHKGNLNRTLITVLKDVRQTIQSIAASNSVKDSIISLLASYSFLKGDRHETAIRSMIIDAILLLETGREQESRNKLTGV